jgi:beta-phosphoglucomutase-like phosphatase (HAD superfamily)
MGRALAMALLAFTAAGLAPAPAFADPAYADVIARVVAARKAGRQAVAVFDIDGTILNPASRTRDIFSHALEGPGAIVTPEQPQLAEAVRSLPLSQHAYDPESTLARAGIVDTAYVRALKTRWSQDFFSNRYLLDDEAIPGAVRYVDSLYAAGCTVVYFTGRDAPRMLGGTAQSLLERGFPIGIVRAQLVMKPDKKLEDFAYKQGALDAIATLGEVVAVFENEPKNINLLHDRFPKALAFYLDQPHSAHAPAVEPGIAQHPDFTSFNP